MGKASDFDRAEANRRLTPEQVAKRKGSHPELRVRADAPAVTINETTLVQEPLEELRCADIGALALRHPSGEVVAMIVPVERYLELVANELASNPSKEVNLDGRIAPSDAEFARSHVEPVDPHGDWIPGSLL